MKDIGSLSFLNLGFRLFFLSAALYAVLSVFIWLIVYFGVFNLPQHSVSPYQWHAHEMIYGYSVAVIAGFLLTAVKTWTGVQPLYGVPLLMLNSLWWTARLLFFYGENAAAGFFDLLFMFLLILAVTYPIVKAKQWKQIGVISKLCVLFFGNLLFYMGLFNLIEDGVRLGIYGGLFLIVGLIMMMGRRVLPFFIEKGCGLSKNIYNSRVIDAVSLFLFVIFFVLELSQYSPFLITCTALLLFIVNAIRLLGWLHHGIWEKSLLWSLYLSMWCIALGFLLYSLVYFTGISKFLAIHMFAYGGIGMVTLSMMSRVSLGHTGRNIHILPKGITSAFLILLLGVVFRTLIVLIAPDYYAMWMGFSQVLWGVSFLIFFVLYFPILTRR